jgi:hypothetical protein
MVAHAWQPAPHMGLLRLRVLDSAPAAGIDPVAGAEPALRAGQLISPRLRGRFAQSLRRAVASAERPRHAL